MSGYEGFAPQVATSLPSEVSVSDDLPNYKREADRLATFRNWPNPSVSPEALAKAGFYYLNDSDKVKCPWCSGVVAEWEVGDNPTDEHRRFFPDCPLILHGPNLLEGDYLDAGIQKFKAPKKPMYACLSARLRTYQNWPRSDIQKPEVLAEVGFYYENTDDQVRCFHCNGGLRSWQKDDDPWFEHAKWFPHCQYVQLAKGEAFISQVLKWPRGRGRFAESAMSLDDAMSTEPVRLALQMGLNAGRIRSTTKRRLEMYGKPYLTAEELVEAVLEGQANEEVYREEAEANRSNLNYADIREMSQICENMLKASQCDNRTESPNISSAQACSSTESTTVVPENSSQPNSMPNSNEIPMSNGLPTNSDCTSENMVELMKQISLEEENRRLKDARTCKICMDDECGVVFLPCGHLVACVLCAPGISQCPICRSPIKGFVRTYLS